MGSIYRVVGENAHVLNASSGNVMTFKMTESEIRDLLQNWADPKFELSEDVASLFSVQTQMNTRLCRANLNNLGMEFGFPTIVNLELNRRCSMRCVHCYIGVERLASPLPSLFEQMTEEGLSHFLEEMREMGVFLLVFTGGEPFLNTRLEYLLESGREKGFVMELFSNLQHIPSWFLKKDPISSMVGRIQVSVYSSDPAVHDRITTSQGSHQRSMDNLKELQRRGFYVEVATPLMKLNFDSWEDTKRVFGNLGVKQDFSWPIVDEYYSERLGKTSLNITAEQLGQFVEKNPDFLIRTEFGDPQSPVCEAGRSMFGVSANGDVFPCSQLPCPVGNTAKTSIRSIYESRGMQKFRDIKNVDTGLKEAYNFCMGENFVETGNPLVQSQFILDLIGRSRKKGGVS